MQILQDSPGQTPRQRFRGSSGKRVLHPKPPLDGRTSEPFVTTQSGAEGVRKLVLWASSDLQAGKPVFYLKARSFVLRHRSSLSLQFVCAPIDGFLLEPQSPDMWSVGFFFLKKANLKNNKQKPSTKWSSCSGCFPTEQAGPLGGRRCRPIFGFLPGRTTRPG